MLNQGRDIPTGFAISVIHVKNVKYKKNEYFHDRSEDYLDIFVNKMNELSSNFVRFPQQKQIILTDEEKEVYSNKTACYSGGKEFKKNGKRYRSLPL